MLLRSKDHPFVNANVIAKLHITCYGSKKVSDLIIRTDVLKDFEGQNQKKYDKQMFR